MRAEEINNKCITLESIFKRRLEKSGCKLGCSRVPSEGDCRSSPLGISG